MFWSTLRVLFPSFFGYWIVMVVVASVAWYYWTQIYTAYSFNWRAPLLLATVASVYMMVNAMTAAYQSAAMVAYQQTSHGMAATTQQVASNAAPEQQPGDSATQMKSNFLHLIESMVQNPDQITPEAKKKLFTDYAALFPRPDVKQIYFTSISAVYSCQRAMWEDAMASYKAKKVVKSEERKECEAMPGTFFQRDKLIDPQMAKSNDEIVINLAAHKRLPASDGKMVEVNQDMIRNALNAQVRQLEALKKIFE